MRCTERRDCVSVDFMRFCPGVGELGSLGILRFFAFARFCALMPARIFERLSISEAL
jgi:hypothetical protein